MVRISLDDAVRDVDLLQLFTRRIRSVHVDVDRPELGADHALSKAMQVRVARRCRAQIVAGHGRRPQAGGRCFAHRAG